MDRDWSPSETAFTTKRLILQRYYQNKTEDIFNKDACVICLEPLEEKMSLYLPCKHVFHYKCCQHLIEGRSYKCPLCRENFSEALPGVGIPVEVETVIFVHVDLYDFLLEMLWQNYEHNAVMRLEEQDLFLEEEEEEDLF
jgi:hypothetical protein